MVRCRDRHQDLPRRTALLIPRLAIVAHVVGAWPDGCSGVVEDQPNRARCGARPRRQTALWSVNAHLGGTALVLTPADQVLKMASKSRQGTGSEAELNSLSSTDSAHDVGHGQEEVDPEGVITEFAG